MDSGMLESSRARVAVVFVLLLVWCGLSAPQAQALCLTQPEDGTWRNSDPNTLSLTQAVLQFICQDQILNGEPHPPGPPWRVHLWGDCLPTDCDWGEVDAEVRTIGERTYVRAVYHHGFATRYVYADMSLYREGQLWIWMWTDFADPDRPDYETQNWFTRE